MPPGSALLTGTECQKTHHSPEGIFTNTPVTHAFTPAQPVAIPLAAATKSGKPRKWEGASWLQAEIYKLLIDTSHCLLGDDFKPPV